MSGELVLVTGGSGFVGAHCILQLLEAGYAVRTTVRSLDREPAVRAMLGTSGSTDALSFVAADLMSDSGWPAAVAGCHFVLHVASPFPLSQPKDENELIVPAREGALRVLRAARDAGVKRVVLTSSFAAIGYGTSVVGRPFTEDDWTDPNAHVSAYVKSKTLAERAAWDFIELEGRGLELAVINPVAIFGPALGPNLSTSVEFVRRLLVGAVPGLPRVSYAMIDVRDVADLHLRAMTNPAAHGERFLAVAGASVSVPEMAAIMRDRMGAAASRVPTRVLPDWLMRVGALFSPELRDIASRLGQVSTASNEKARRLLDWAPRSNEEALVATAQSIIDLGLIERRTQPV